MHQRPIHRPARRPSRRSTRLGGLAALATTALIVSACSSGSDSAAPAKASASTDRLAVSVEGGVVVLDATTLDVVDRFDTEEFTRLNAAGDGRHVLVTTSAGFQVLDTEEPALTDLVFPATTAGHVVRHAGKTVLYDDGTGGTTILRTDDLADVDDTLPRGETHTADAAHHGVSISLEDGTLLTTVGDETSRSGARALEKDGSTWTEVASNAECPGIHGEGTTAGEVAVFGCEDGALVYDGTEFTKIAAPDAFGRMGNVWVSDSSPVAMGDYKTDPDAEGYLLDSIALVDTETKSFDVLELPEGVQYTFRDGARGPDDLGYVLATDGSIHVVDPEKGELVDEYPVIGAWEGPAEWQDAHPAITVEGDTAYVTEPSTRSVHAVDLTTGEKTATTTLDGVPNEIAVALG